MKIASDSRSAKNGSLQLMAEATEFRRAQLLLLPLLIASSDDGVLIRTAVLDDADLG